MDVQEIEETRGEPISSLIREPSVADVPPTQHINEGIGWQSALPSVSTMTFGWVLNIRSTIKGYCTYK